MEHTRKSNDYKEAAIQLYQLAAHQREMMQRDLAEESYELAQKNQLLAAYVELANEVDKF